MANTLLFLDIDFGGGPIKGESTAGAFSDLIEVESFNWEVTAKHDMNSTKQKASTVLPKRLTIEKFFDRSSSVLTRYMREQNPFKTAKLQFADAAFTGEKIKHVLCIELRNGYVENIELSASASGDSMAVNETVELSFDSLKLEYFPRKDPTAEKTSRASSRSTGGAFTFETRIPAAKS